MIDEAQRQRDLLAAIWSDRGDHGDTHSAGIAVYRANADANATRALEAAFPTVAQMLGADDFRHLGAEHRRAAPPQRGDLGEWGDALPAWIDSHRGLAEWPWLADAARLDLAVHRAERAADASLDAASLAALADHDPAQLRLVPMPGLALVRSRWPIVAIHAAHRASGAEREAAFTALQRRLAPQQDEIAIVARSGWRGAVEAIDAAGAAFVEAMLHGASLAASLAAAAEADARFDFTAWLQRALGSHWLQQVRITTNE